MSAQEFEKIKIKIKCGFGHTCSKPLKKRTKIPTYGAERNNALRTAYHKELNFLTARNPVLGLTIYHCNSPSIRNTLQW
jgi:hypothetical protein